MGQVGRELIPARGSLAAKKAELLRRERTRQMEAQASREEEERREFERIARRKEQYLERQRQLEKMPRQTPVPSTDDSTGNFRAALSLEEVDCNDHNCLNQMVLPSYLFQKSGGGEARAEASVRGTTRSSVRQSKATTLASTAPLSRPAVPQDVHAQHNNHEPSPFASSSSRPAPPAEEETTSPVVGGAASTAIKVPTEETFTISTTASNQPCAVCNVGDRTHIAMPCMHYSFCEDCVGGLLRKQKTCPVCHTGNVSYTRVFY